VNSLLVIDDKCCRRYNNLGKPVVRVAMLSSSHSIGLQGNNDIFRKTTLHVGEIGTFVDKDNHTRLAVSWPHRKFD
jgi:hypothetical protein